MYFQVGTVRATTTACIILHNELPIWSSEFKVIHAINPAAVLKSTPEKQAACIDVKNKIRYMLPGRCLTHLKSRFHPYPFNAI